ncbi:MAG: GTPase HflX [Candidatus Omnitrophica bacterium]|nr:GTPase HflX [Candidatus Omnitrophota bacterium]
MEKVLLVVVTRPGMRKYQIKETVDEMEQLIASSNGRVVEAVTARVDDPSPSHYLRKGNLEKISDLVREHKPHVIIFSIDLSPTHMRNIEQMMRMRIVDRTGLILDIFARHASTREGKLQVELAQLLYLLPRLSEIWEQFSRLGGGIGTRGPGEQKLEVDRRKIRQKIGKIKFELENVRAHRARIRGQRKRNNMLVISIVGYTNAGKSTLLNRLTGAHVVTQDKLFATLDPTTRRLTLRDGTNVLLTDTVGFLQDLPHTLIEAFKATLEEIKESDLILDVCDVSDSFLEDKQKAVDMVLKEIQADGLKRIRVLNKIDSVTGEEARARVLRKYDNYIIISAKTGEGLNALEERIYTELVIKAEKR